jgi:major inositol transporter-like SP family MFS transporter
MEFLGLTLTFWLYAAIGVSGIAFWLIYLPETKGKTLEEIESYWRKKYGPRKN